MRPNQQFKISEVKQAVKWDNLSHKEFLYGIELMTAVKNDKYAYDPYAKFLIEMYLKYSQ
jgi:hypothetical protein